MALFRTKRANPTSPHGAIESQPRHAIGTREGDENHNPANQVPTITYGEERLSLCSDLMAQRAADADSPDMPGDAVSAAAGSFSTGPL
jgi:hypothetical protein